MTALTDRYVWAVVRLLPEAQRPEIDREVRSLVAEMVDARTGDGDGRSDEQLERNVLAELGDPALLAARYVERPRALVSQEHFPEYVRTLKLVLVIVVPLVASLAALGAALEEDPTFGRALGAAAAGVFNTTVQVSFWVTLVYAFADRWKADVPWDVDALPEVPTTARRPGTADLVAGIIVTVLTAVALVWQHTWPLLEDGGGDGVPLLHPDLWTGPGQLLLALLGVSLVVQVAVLARRRWSVPLAAANLAADAGLLAVVAWGALDERLLNTRFLALLAERAELDQVPSISPWVPIALVAVVVVWDSAEALLSARRSSAT